jgi:hypothetical protein
MTTETGRPQTKDGTKLCIAVTRQGVTAYGNKAAFESCGVFQMDGVVSPVGTL